MFSKKLIFSSFLTTILLAGFVDAAYGATAKIASKEYVDAMVELRQMKLVPGAGITIDPVTHTITATGTGGEVNLDDYVLKTVFEQSIADLDAAKQDVLTAGDNITITGNVISAAVADGKNIVLQYPDGGTHIQWQVEGDSGWNDLINIEELRGADGVVSEVVYVDVSGNPISGTDAAYPVVLNTAMGTNSSGDDILIITKGDLTIDLSEYATVEYVDAETDALTVEINKRQMKLNAGNGISIDPTTNTITATGTGGDVDLSPYALISVVNAADQTLQDNIDLKQDILTAGDNITIVGNVISAAVADGKNIALQVPTGGTHIQWQVEGDSTWTDLISLDELRGEKGADGAAGADADNVTIGINDVAGVDTIQWKYLTGADQTWKTLVTLDAISGTDGAAGEKGEDGVAGMNADNVTIAVNDVAGVDTIQWKYLTGADQDWKTLVSLADLSGTDGTVKEIVYVDSAGNAIAGDSTVYPIVLNTELNTTSGVLTVTKGVFAIELGAGQYVTDMKFENGRLVVSRADGTSGTVGSPGEDAKNVEFQIGTGAGSVDWLQWSYLGENNWVDLVKVSDLKGTDGLPGEKGEDGAAFTYDMFTTEQLAALRGEKGEDGAAGADGAAFTYDMFTTEQLAALRGEKGEDGAAGADADNVTININDVAGTDTIQWKYLTGADQEWKTLISIEDLKGTDGAAGTDGLSADNVTIAVNDVAGVDTIQWKYLTGADQTWKTLISTEDLKGLDGSVNAIVYYNEMGTELTKAEADALPSVLDVSLNTSTKVLSVVKGTLEVDLSAYYNRTEVDGLLLQKLSTTLQDSGSGYVSNITVDSSNGQLIITRSAGTGGEPGADGDQVVLRENDTDGYIQWKYSKEPDTSWRNLLAYSEIMGEAGSINDIAYENASGASISKAVADALPVVLGTTFDSSSKILTVRKGAVNTGAIEDEAVTLGKLNTDVTNLIDQKIPKPTANCLTAEAFCVLTVNVQDAGQAPVYTWMNLSEAYLLP